MRQKSVYPTLLSMRVNHERYLLRGRKAIEIEIRSQTDVQNNFDGRTENVEIGENRVRQKPNRMKTT